MVEADELDLIKIRSNFQNVKAMEAITEVTKLLKQLALRPCYDVIEIQPMGRLETNPCFSLSYVT